MFYTPFFPAAIKIWNNLPENLINHAPCKVSKKQHLFHATNLYLTNLMHDNIHS